MKDQKWLQKWSGPWTVVKLIKDATVEIMDPATNNSRTVAVKRLKLWNDGKDMHTYAQFQELNERQELLKQQCQDRHQLGAQFSNNKS